MNDLLTIGTALAAAIITIATIIPRILANLKRDNLDGKFAGTQMDIVDGLQTSYEKQIELLDDRMIKMEERVDSMDMTIHTQAIKITRLIVVVIHMRGLLVSNAVPIPENIQTEIDLLTTLTPNIK